MTAETESIKRQILSTDKAEILLEENDFLIIKWLLSKAKFCMVAYPYGKTGMANSEPWEYELTEQQATYYLKHIDEAIAYFESKHHYFHIEIKEVDYNSIANIDEHGIKFRDYHWLTYKECAFNFKRKYPNSSGICVGERDITANPPYIELYSFYAHDKILFNKKGLFSKKKNTDDFLYLQNLIQEFGYTTYDLS